MAFVWSLRVWKSVSHLGETRQRRIRYYSKIIQLKQLSLSGNFRIKILNVE